MPVGTFDLVIIAIYFLIVIGIGYHSMKKIHSFSDYALAGRSIPLALLFASMAATATIFGWIKTIPRRKPGDNCGRVESVSTKTRPH
jgi:hypothetical protein